MKIFVVIFSLFWLIACSESTNHSKSNICENECESIGTYCKDNSIIQCYEDETKCLIEKKLLECLNDEICNSNVCLKSNCENECLETESKCDANKPYEIKICGNFDEDICFEWQSINCPQNHICENNVCVYESCIDNETKECGSDTGECQKGLQTCNSGVWSECVGEIKPVTEICDRKDNNCDGTTDEGCSCVNGDTKECGIDTGECQKGSQTCNNGVWSECVGEITPFAEICDGKDNNCDGNTDEGCSCVNGDTKECGIDTGECQKGSQTCNNGIWSDCEGDIEPTEETCNGFDDNCDNDIDNIINPPQADKHFGVCSLSVKVCNGTEFVEPDYTLLENYEQTETFCDNIDNDCDNDIDNVTKSCYFGPPGTNNIGICKSGSQTCLAGHWGNCDGQVLPINEICDNYDNDCDGLIDGMTESCYSGPAGTSGVGECKSGIKTCTAGNFGVCAGEVVPTSEICDEKDNDCDNSADEMIHLEGANCVNDTPPIAGSKTALNFNGGKEFVRTNNNIDLKNISFTVELWVKIANSQNDPAIITNKDWNAGKNKGFVIALIDGGKWKYNIGDGTNRIDCDGERITDNIWHHIAGVYNSVDKKVTIYQDGVKVCEDINNSIDNSKTADNVKLRIGQDRTEKYGCDILGNNCINFDGIVDEVRVWKKVKTQDEIKSEMFKHLRGNETSLTLYYKFDEQNGTVVKDTSVNVKTGEIVNSAEYVQSDAFKNRIAILNTALTIYSGYDPQNKQLITTVPIAVMNGITNIDNFNQTITYIPNNNYLGTDTFTYQLTNFALTDTSTVNIEVIPPYCSDCVNDIDCFVCFIRHNGGYGGGDNPLTQCPENHVVVGIATTQTSYAGYLTLNYINLICKEKNGNILTGNDIVIGEVGSTGSNDPNPLRCDDVNHPNGVMVGELIWLSPSENDYVQNVGLVCNTLENIADGSYSDTYNVMPTGEVNPSISNCRNGYIITGYKVKNGMVIDSINFLCGDVQ